MYNASHSELNRPNHTKKQGLLISSLFQFRTNNIPLAGRGNEYDTNQLYAKDDENCQN